MGNSAFGKVLRVWLIGGLTGDEPLTLPKTVLIEGRDAFPEQR
jgi:hypothetical protein